MAIGLDFSSFTGMAWNMVGGLLYLAATIPILIGLFFAVLYFMKWGKFVYPVLLYRDIGTGKAIFDTSLRAGKFKANKKIFGLIDWSGEVRMELGEGRGLKFKGILQNFSDRDLHDIGGKKGFIVVQSPHDPKIFVPINKANVSNLDLILDIAPGSYRAASEQILRAAHEEVKPNLDTGVILQFVGYIVFIIGLILVIQFATGSIAKITELMHQSCEQYAASHTAVGLPSSAP